MRKKKIILVVILCVAALAMAGCVGGEKTSNQTDAQREGVQQEDIQKQAEELFDKGDYEKARGLYKAAGNQEMVSECTYLIAKNCLEQKDYASAIKEFETIPDYKNATEYLDKCQMELKYEKFDYDGFQKLMDESLPSMTHEEIREYMEESIAPMYLTWYDNDDKSMEISKYAIDGKTYCILSYDNSDGYIGLNVFYSEDEKTKHHLILNTDCEYADVTDDPTIGLTVDDKLYRSFTNKKAEEYAALREDAESADGYYATTEYYLPGYAYSNSLGTYVYYAYVAYDEEQKTNVIRVECTIGNTGSGDVQFVASNYFSLNYNGVITSARPTQYDYTTLSSGGQFTTELVFNCPSATRAGDTLNMTMAMENAQIHLGPVPLDTEERSGFAGTYMSSSTSYDTIITVMANGNGTYNITYVADALGIHRIYENIALNEKNKFTIGDETYTWDEVDNVLYSYGYDTWDEEDYKTIYYMQNPMK